jgi:hypothetical protein
MDQLLFTAPMTPGRMPHSVDCCTGPLLDRNPDYQRAQAADEASPGGWAHWRYEPDEWRRYCRWEMRFGLIDSLGCLGVFLLVGVVAISGATIGLALAGALDDEGFRNFLAQFFFGGGALIAGATLLNCYMSFRRRMQGPAEVIIGPTRIREAGVTVPLFDYQAALTLVEVDPRYPTLLRFETCKSHDMNGPGSGTTDQPWVRVVFVPIPQGQEAAAAQLATRFQREILLYVPGSTAVLPPVPGVTRHLNQIRPRWNPAATRRRPATVPPGAIPAAGDAQSDEKTP